jgi:hypothetical protein
MPLKGKSLTDYIVPKEHAQRTEQPRRRKLHEKREAVAHLARKRVGRLDNDGICACVE